MTIRVVWKKHNMVVLSDEIYGQLRFDGEHVSLAAVYPEASIVTTGFSKWSSAGGWRVGYAVVPKTMAALKAALISAASHTYSCAPAPMQFAIEKATKAVERIP